MKQYVTIKVSPETASQIKEEYESFLVPTFGEYELFRIKNSSFIITAYQSAHGLKIVFEGEDILELAQKYDPKAQIKEPKTKITTSWQELADHIGSDEVGTGDFFGPIVVCAVYYRKEDYQLLNELGIMDSKSLSDQRILEIGPLLDEHFPHSLVICHNDKYNELIDKGFNMNSIKAWLHNEVLGNVQRKIEKKVPLYVDEFCSESLYYRYLRDNDHIITGIIFHPKGESLYPAVAIASCLARYAFLKTMAQYEKKLSLSLPLGAGKKVDQCALSIYQQFGIATLNHYVKKNFKNYQRLFEVPDDKDDT